MHLWIYHLNSRSMCSTAFLGLEFRENQIESNGVREELRRLRMAGKAILRQWGAKKSIGLT